MEKDKKYAYWINGRSSDSENSKQDYKNDIHSNSNNICYNKAKYVAIKSGQLCQRLAKKNDYVILNNYLTQLVRSSSSIYANYCEGNASLITTKDRISKFNISLKEAEETLAWLNILYGLKEISQEEYDAITNQTIEIIKILSKAILTMKKNQALKNL